MGISHVRIKLNTYSKLERESKLNAWPWHIHGTSDNRDVAILIGLVEQNADPIETNRFKS